MFWRHSFLVLAIVLPVLAYFLGNALIPEYLAHFNLVSGVWAVVLLLIVSPILEEVVFRGFLQDYLLSKIDNKFIVVLLVNFVFVALHYHINHETIFLILIFGCGVIWSVIKLKYHKLIYPIFLHAYYNLSFLLMLGVVHR